MYDVAPFIKPVPMDTERSGEFFGGESQRLEFFRYERSRTFVAEIIREKMSPNTLTRSATPLVS
jgi:hypothetical protein